MTWLRQRWLPLVVLAAAMVTLIGSIAVTVTAGRDNGWGPGGMGMMASAVRGDGAVGSLAAAGQAADRYGRLNDEGAVDHVHAAGEPERADPIRAQ
jgi:hypothetical protein